jgi:hypothetical protein
MSGLACSSRLAIGWPVTMSCEITAQVAVHLCWVGESVRLVDGSNNASSSDPVHQRPCRFTVGMSTRLPLPYHVGRFVIAANASGNLQIVVRT